MSTSKPIVAAFMVFLLWVGMTAYAQTPTQKAQRQEIQAYKKLFVAYPDSDALYSGVRLHLIPKWQEQYSILVMMTQFQDGEATIANRYWITTKGAAHKDRDVYNWALQAAQDWQLTEEQFAEVRKTLTTLPPSAPPSPLKNLLVVTYRDGKKRTTRLYNRSNLPNGLRDLLRIEPRTTLIPVLLTP